MINTAISSYIFDLVSAIGDWHSPMFNEPGTPNPPYTPEQRDLEFGSYMRKVWYALAANDGTLEEPVGQGGLGFVPLLGHGHGHKYHHRMSSKRTAAATEIIAVTGTDTATQDEEQGQKPFYVNVVGYNSTGHNGSGWRGGVCGWWKSKGIGKSFWWAD